MLGIYTPPVCAGERNHGLSATDFLEPFILAARARDCVAADQERAEHRHSDTIRAIAEAQIRTNALASLIADGLRAGRDTEYLERRLTTELDTLLSLRTDYGALCFLDATDSDAAN